jgi:hypothetical protein
MEFFRRHIGLILRIVICAAILYYIAGKIEWAKTLGILKAMDPLWLAASFLAFAPMLAITAWRWEVLLAVQGIKLPFAQVFQLNLVGQFFNAFLLGSTGGDVVKIYYATRAAPRKRSAAGLSVVIDRLIGLLVLIGIALVFIATQWDFLTRSAPGDESDQAVLGFSHLTPALAVYLVLAIAVGATVVIGASLMLPGIKRWAKARGLWERLPLHGTLERVFDAYQAYSQAYSAMGVVILQSIVNHAINIVLAWCILRAMHLDADFWKFASILPIIFLLIAVPVTISGFGVREWLCILFFALFGFSKEHAIAFSLTIWMVYTGWSVVGGLMYLRYETPPDLSGEQVQA